MYMDTKSLKQKIPSNLGEFKTFLKTLPNRYNLDRVELGKIMVIASTMLLVVSVHSVYVLDSSLEQLEQSNQELETSSNILSDSDFQSAINSLGDIQGSNIDQQIAMVAEGFVDADQALERLEETEEDLEDTKEMHQWLVVTSIVGIVAGVSVVFI